MKLYYVLFVFIFMMNNLLFSNSYIENLFEIDGIFITGSELKKFDSFFLNKTEDINKNITKNDLSNDIYLVTRVVSKEKFKDILVYLEVEIITPNILKGEQIIFECGFSQGSEYFIKKVFTSLNMNSKYKNQILQTRPEYKIKKSTVK